MAPKLLTSAIVAAFVFTAVSSAAQEQQVIRKIAAGTGFYISHDGYILTANHVVASCSDHISAHNEQMVLKVQLLATQPTYDLALLKITPNLVIPHIATIRSVRQPLQVGENVAVAGYPSKTTDLNSEFVSFTTNNAKITNTKGPRNNEQWIQFSFSARPGFSGGPVLDSYGNIIGVTSGGTCMNRSCSESYNSAMKLMKNATTMEEVKEADEAIVANSDTNIAASQSAIRAFLAQNNLAMEERDSVVLPSEQRLNEIAESIVNLRCTQNDEDFKNSTRVIKLH